MLPPILPFPEFSILKGALPFVVILPCILPPLLVMLVLPLEVIPPFILPLPELVMFKGALPELVILPWIP